MVCLLPEKGKFYKANLHAHTSVSDGKYSPEEVKRAYLEHGYSVVAFTDHEVLVPHPSLSDENFLALTSFEVSVNGTDRGRGFEFVKTYHLNLYAKEENALFSSAFSEDAVWLAHSKEFIPPVLRGRRSERVCSPEFVNGLIAQAKREGFLVSYNHPVWSCQNYSDYADLKGLWGVECYNTNCARIGLRDTAQPFDDLLRRGERVFPLASDDSHGDGDRFGGFVMVKAEELSYGAVMRALERGDFYASLGPAIHSLTLQDGILEIRTSAVEEIFLTTERRSVLFRRGENLTGADFDLRPYFERSKLADAQDPAPYFRLTLRDKKGAVAYTRAYFLSEFAL